MLVRLLRRFNYPAQAAFSGSDLFELLHEAELPTLIILDVRMPDMDGWEILAALRADHRWKRIPVIMYTADSSPQGRADARRLGAQDYIVKGSLLWPDLLFKVQQLSPEANGMDSAHEPPATLPHH